MQTNTEREGGGERQEKGLNLGQSMAKGLLCRNRVNFYLHFFPTTLSMLNFHRFFLLAGAKTEGDNGVRP